MYTRNFKDEKGKPKFVQRINKDLVHTGNTNYIEANDEIVFHQTEKIVKKFSHACGLNKMM